MTASHDENKHVVLMYASVGKIYERYERNKRAMKHVFFTIEGGDEKLLDDEEHIILTLKNTADAVKATLLKTSSHKFHPCGVTAVALLSESHISIHSWPELGKAACDIFTCGNHTQPELGVEIMQTAFAASKVTNLKNVNRGNWDSVCTTEK